MIVSDHAGRDKTLPPDGHSYCSFKPPASKVPSHSGAWCGPWHVGLQLAWSQRALSEQPPQQNCPVSSQIPSLSESWSCFHHFCFCFYFYFLAQRMDDIDKYSGPRGKKLTPSWATLIWSLTCHVHVIFQFCSATKKIALVSAQQIFRE